METYEVMGIKLQLVKGKSEEIENVFKPFYEKINNLDVEFEEIINQEITPELSKKAKELRLKYVPLRTGSEKAGKGYKEDVLKLSKAIDSIRKKVKETASEKEKMLLAIETYQERIEAKKKEVLKVERLKELEKYNIDGSVFGVENMSIDIWESFLNSQKFAYETEIKRKKKEFIDRMKADKERGNREEKLKAENEKIRKEKEEVERLARQEAEKQETILRKEREEKQKLEKELQAKQEAERLDEIEKEQIELKKQQAEIAKRQAPDREKFNIWLSSFNIDIPEFTDNKFKNVAIDFVSAVQNSAQIAWDKL
jgi:septal ring factor EnvC (AmiA/AmiB activator)